MIKISGESFDLMDGLFGLSLSPLVSQWDDRTLYFHALASVTENYVPTSVIRNQTAWTTGSANPRSFQVRNFNILIFNHDSRI